MNANTHNPAQPMEAKTSFEGSSTLISGPPGTGKTSSLVTAVEWGLNLAAIFTEPRGPQSLMERAEALNLPVDNIHWAYVSPARPSWDAMIESADEINKNSFEGLAQKKQGINKADYRQMLELLGLLREFKCERTGENFGPVDELSTNWLFALDGMSGLNIMAMDLVVGSKPVKAMGEWGVAMDAEERLIQKLCTDCACHVAVISHIDREHDEITGAKKIMVSALGRKLAPRIPRFFSDHVEAYREGHEFFWSTEGGEMDTKNRLLPLSAKLEPSFVPLLDEWKRRRDLASGQAA